MTDPLILSHTSMTAVHMCAYFPHDHHSTSPPSRAEMRTRSSVGTEHLVRARVSELPSDVNAFQLAPASQTGAWLSYASDRGETWEINDITVKCVFITTSKHSDTQTTDWRSACAGGFFFSPYSPLIYSRFQTRRNEGLNKTNLYFVIPRHCSVSVGLYARTRVRACMCFICCCSII